MPIIQCIFCFFRRAHHNIWALFKATRTTILEGIWWTFLFRHWMMQCFLNFTLEREKNFSNLKMMMHLQWSRFNEKIANEKRPWRFLHPFVTKSKVKATQVFGFQGDFLGKRRGFSRVNFLPRHLVSVAASGFSGSVAVQGLLLILVQQPQQPQRLLLLYCRIYCWFNIEKLVSLSHTTKCFALSAALLGFDICHARGTLSCLLLTAVNTTVLVSFAYLHTQKELLLLLCERIFFFKVASRASTAFLTWQACDFSQRQTLQKRPSNKKEKRNKAVFCQNVDVLISFLHFHCGKMHHYLPCFSSLLLPWSFEFIMEFLWKWVDE